MKNSSIRKEETRKALYAQKLCAFKAHKAKESVRSHKEIISDYRHRGAASLLANPNQHNTSARCACTACVREQRESRANDFVILANIARAYAVHRLAAHAINAKDNQSLHYLVTCIKRTYAWLIDFLLLSPLSTCT